MPIFEERKPPNNHSPPESGLVDAQQKVQKEVFTGNRPQKIDIKYVKTT